jgi:hypothetical protein
MAEFHFQLEHPEGWKRGFYAIQGGGIFLAVREYVEGKGVCWDEDLCRDIKTCFVEAAIEAAGPSAFIEQGSDWIALVPAEGG